MDGERGCDITLHMGIDIFCVGLYYIKIVSIRVSSVLRVFTNILFTNSIYTDTHCFLVRRMNVCVRFCLQYLVYLRFLYFR